ncbi:O-antigen ligase family protein [Nocardioides sp. zg-ZUI104]|uniref:O-antigen ligase family protein n=1 Tax=Nocardioides faecalis TaxID=2803858 RepID=UPI001BD0343C|nr:O-antigen ligase family protein [Nocardioides faecalis]MBS4751769.1 O-antigen ligase family protein [Nocardioides faecalis]
MPVATVRAGPIVGAPARRAWLRFSADGFAGLILALLWLRWMGNYVLNSLLGDKRFVPIGETAVVHPVAEGAGRVFLLLLLAACAAAVLFRMNEIPRAGLGRLAVVLAPWAVIAVRDAANGLVRPETLMLPLLVLALAALRPSADVLRWVGVMVGLTAVGSLVLGLLVPEGGIVREASGEYRAADKALVPAAGLLQGMFGSENSLALFLTLGLAMVFLVRPRWLAVSFVVAVCLAVLWSSSRSGLLTLSVVLGLAGVCALLRSRALDRALSLVLLGAVTGLVVVGAWLPLQPWKEEAFTTRGGIWRGSLDTWLGQAELLGLGSDWYERVARTATTPFNGGTYHGHNELVHLGVTGGVLLVVATALWFGVQVAATVHPRRDSFVTAGLLAAALVVGGFLEVPLGQVDRSPFWLVGLVPLTILLFDAGRPARPDPTERREPQSQG